MFTGFASMLMSAGAGESTFAGDVRIDLTPRSVRDD